MSKRKKNKKRTPQQKNRKKKLREMRQRAKRNARLRIENQKLELLKIDKKRYSKITTKDFENWLVEAYKTTDEKSVVDISYEPPTEMKMFFDEFSTRTNMKEYTRIGRLNSFIHENGIILLENKKEDENENDVGKAFFNCNNQIYLSWIVADVDNKRKGWGTEMMNHLKKLSKEYDYTIKLTAGGKDEKWNDRKDMRFWKYVKDGKYTTNELVSWYKSIGFSTDPTKCISIIQNKKKTYKKLGLQRVLMYPSSSVFNELKFPSIKGYDTTYGFSYSSTSDCMDKMIYGN